MASADPTRYQRDRDTVEQGAALVIVTAAILAATLMQTLDTTIVNVALPVIQGNLGATLDEGAWVVTGYIISAVIVIPLTPWLQVRFGRRQYYATAIIGFTIASILCGTSGSINELIFWRIVQGAFGGGLIATAQATLRDTFPQDKIGMSQGIFALGAIVGPAIGPTIGGWLTDNYSWNWIFFINVLPGAFAGTVMLMRLKNPVNPRPIPVDGIGLVLLMAGLGCLQYILDEGQRNDWFADDRITACAAISALGLIGFVVWELWGTKRPIVDLRVLMRYRQIGAGASLAFVIGGAIFGAIVVFPQYVQGILGFTATASGELIFYRAAFIAVGAPFAVRLATSGRVDVRWLLLTGFVLVGLTQFWFAAITTSGNDFDTFILPNMISGIGFSLLYIPLSIAILTGLPPDVIPKAASFQSLFQQLGGSISTAGIVTLLARRDAFHQSTLAAFAQPGYAPFAQFLNQHGSLARFYQQIVIQANTMGFADAQWVIGVLALVLIPMILVLPNSRKAATANVSFE